MNTGQRISGSNIQMNKIQSLLEGSHEIGETGQQMT